MAHAAVVGALEDEAAGHDAILVGESDFDARRAGANRQRVAAELGGEKVAVRVLVGVFAVDVSGDFSVGLGLDDDGHRAGRFFVGIVHGAAVGSDDVGRRGLERGLQRGMRRDKIHCQRLRRSRKHPAIFQDFHPVKTISAAAIHAFPLSLKLPVE